MYEKQKDSDVARRGPLMDRPFVATHLDLGDASAASGGRWGLQCVNKQLVIEGFGAGRASHERWGIGT